jgi:hypothetical protein
MATFGKIPVALRWLLAIFALVAVAAVVIKFIVASGSDTTAQTPAAAPASAPAAQAVPPAAAPLAQQAPAPASSAQTVQLTPDQLKNLQGHLWHNIFAIYRAPGDPATPQAAAQMDQFQRDFNYVIYKREVHVLGPVTQGANGIAKAEIRIEAWDHDLAVNAKNGLVAKRNATVEFTLDPQTKRIKQVITFRPH